MSNIPASFHFLFRKNPVPVLILFLIFSGVITVRTLAETAPVEPTVWTPAGVQTEYPAVVKIVGRGQEETKDTGTVSITMYYGSGVYVAEQGKLGIVLTNWHVVSESRDSLQVYFPGFCSEGRVILADETWDIAAVVVRNPKILPIPISLEVPQLNEQLWVAGYGQNADMTGFQMASGKVLQYVILGKEEGLPIETIAISTGVRQGDSGGPVFNRYGELAGILWGSNGSETMGTFCLRLQAFLTQAQFQLQHQTNDPGLFFRQFRHQEPKKIGDIKFAARNALMSSGIFPISTRPVYREITATDDSSLTPNGRPPYPAVISPTFLAQQTAIGRAHPEVYPQNSSIGNPGTQTVRKPEHLKAGSLAISSDSYDSEDKIRNIPSQFPESSHYAYQTVAWNNMDNEGPVSGNPNSSWNSGNSTSPNIKDQEKSDAENTTGSKPENTSAADSEAENHDGNSDDSDKKLIFNDLLHIPVQTLQTALVAVLIFILFLTTVRTIIVANEREEKARERAKARKQRYRNTA